MLLDSMIVYNPKHFMSKIVLYIMRFDLAFSMLDSVKEIHKLYEVISTSAKESNFPKDDIRGKFFQNCGHLLSNVIMLHNSFAAIDNPRSLSDQDIVRIFGFPDLNTVSDDVQNCSGFIISGLITEFLFQVENMFAILLTENDGQKHRGFEKIIDEMLVFSDVNNAEEMKKDFLALSYIRNTKHSDGIHNNDDFTHTIENVDFKFEKGKLNENNLLIQILVAIERIFKNIVEILKQPMISNMTQTTILRNVDP